MNSAWVQIGIPALAVILAAVISGAFSLRSAHKTHKATEDADKAARTTAEAAMLNAYTKAAEESDLRWARYLEAEQKRGEHNEREIAKNAQKIEDLELRLLEADQRAQDWQKLYRKAEIYLRKLVLWIRETVPHEAYPAPPPELEIEL